MEKVLIDTDVIIDFLRGYSLRTKSFFSKINNTQIKVFISLISIVELYAGIEEENSQQEISLKQLLSLSEIIPIDFNLSKLAGKLRRKYRLSITDSIVAATSYNKKTPLFTFNTKHFRDIVGISLYNQN